MHAYLIGKFQIYKFIKYLLIHLFFIYKIMDKYINILNIYVYIVALNDSNISSVILNGN